MAQTIRFEGLSLPVSDVARSVEFYQQFGFQVEQYGPQFALLRLGEGTLGLLKSDVLEQTHTLRERIHIELSTDHLDELYGELQGRGVIFLEPPHDEPWERAMATPDPDGYHLEIAQGRRGHNAPGTS
jgi:catechol 2,3-dioxygenase-like lactoylglutathione lyase family enzyme